MSDILWDRSVKIIFEFKGATPENFVPFVDYKDRAQQWRWIGAERDSDEKLAEIFKFWILNKKDADPDHNEGGQSPPPPRRYLF